MDVFLLKLIQIKQSHSLGSFYYKDVAAKLLYPPEDIRVLYCIIVTEPVIAI